MEKRNVVVTFQASPEGKAILGDVLGSASSLTFLDEAPAGQRAAALERADVLLIWRLAREIQPEDEHHRSDAATFLNQGESRCPSITERISLHR